MNQNEIVDELQRKTDSSGYTEVEQTKAQRILTNCSVEVIVDIRVSDNCMLMVYELDNEAYILELDYINTHGFSFYDRRITIPDILENPILDNTHQSETVSVDIRVDKYIFSPKQQLDVIASGNYATIDYL